MFFSCLYTPIEFANTGKIKEEEDEEESNLQLDNTSRENPAAQKWKAVVIEDG